MLVEHVRSSKPGKAARRLQFDRSYRGERGLLASSVALVGGLAGFAGSAEASGTPAVCGTTFDAYTVSDAQRAECGIKGFPLQNKVVHADGSADYMYLVEGDRPITIHSLPPGFNSATATPAELAHFGIPAEPPVSQPASRAIWEQVVGSGKLHSVTPPDALYESLTKMTQKVDNWAGWVAYGNSGQFNVSEMGYTEPINNTPNGCLNDAASYWTGLASQYHQGEFTGWLAQDGTAQGARGGLGNDQAWWEILPAYAMPVPGLYATEGQGFKAQTRWNGNNTFNFYLLNASSGASFQMDEGGSTWDGTLAEFLVEKPYDSAIGAHDNLLNFGTWTVNPTRTDGNYTTQYTRDDLEMYFNQSVPLALADSMDSQGGFHVHYKACN